MAKKYFIIAGLLIVALGGAAFGLDKFADQKAEQEIEQKLSLGTGLGTDCTKANVNLLQNNVQFMDIKVNNIDGFASPYLFRIKRMEVQAKSLLKTPLEIEKVVIEDVAVNVDVQFNDNATTPEEMMSINIKKISEKGKNLPSKNSDKTDDLKIAQMQFNKINFTIFLQLPGGGKSAITKEFEINQITLEQVTGNNLPDKLSSALQEKILTEITSLSNEQNSPQLNSILEKLNKRKLPSPPSQPQNPSLPSPPSPPSQPKKPSLPSPPSPLSQPNKPSLPSPPSPPSPLSQPNKPSLPSPPSPPSPLSQPNKPSPPFPPI
jgi:hypothetical protein